MSSQEKKIINLFLDRERLNSIQIELDNKINCESIISKNKDSLSDKIYSIYKKNIDDCRFLIIENKVNKKNDDIPILMEFKINKKMKLYNLLQNPHYNLYFLPKRKNTLEERIKARNENMIIENRFESAETNYFMNKSNVEEYLSKSIVFFYDSNKQIFTKEKGSIDEQKIIIFKSNTNKEVMEISIKDIIKALYYSENSQVPYRKNFPIKGEKPKFYIEILTNKQTFYFGQFKENLFFQWENGIKKAMTKYNNFNIDLNLDIKINSSKTALYAVHHSIMDNCFMINKILFNEEKRKMLFSIFPEKKIASIIINILTYKDLIHKSQYLEAWMRFKEILTYIETYDPSVISNNSQNQKKNLATQTKPPIDERIKKIFNKNTIIKYKKVSDESNENVKKINMVNASLDLFKIEMNRALNNILKENLFDDDFNHLYKIYIIPFFKEAKHTLEKSSLPSEKPPIRQKFQFLLAIYFNQIFNTTADNFDDLFMKICGQNGRLKSEIFVNEIIG